jgi:hypothetical protein
MSLIKPTFCKYIQILVFPNVFFNKIVVTNFWCFYYCWVGTVEVKSVNLTVVFWFARVHIVVNTRILICLEICN